MKVALDKGQFGPWALVTGASSGIGKEFARQIAASGINVVLVARRGALLAELGRAISQEFDVQYRALAMDLSQEGFLDKLAEATNDLDIAHHFGRWLVERGQGGLLFVGAMGAHIGRPYMANDGGAKAYVQSFSEGLHVELKPLGVHVTVLPPGLTDTPVIAKLGLTPDAMPMKPMGVEQCVSEGLKALQENRSMIIPGRLNRIMNAVVPASLARGMTAKMFKKTLAKPRPQVKPQTQPQPKTR
jgi:short-subunit dehydrogenase